ncbi:hypothetical protein CALCODRAFT_475217 [Calocera cornea HHB12733]|uniref:RING-CH-type domain-containing protein n=1 Tax=Calocera cornea HHB12733 TaxID=1353952 RepID=A0A165DL82_9BASI|nr:hypothetical protein CALCODRAFT_475217 [Calocera cornea HHB12733]
MDFDEHHPHVLPPPRDGRLQSPSPSENEDEKAVEDFLIEPRTPSPPPGPEDERMCRICFGGVEDEADMGKLIRPCLCKGSVSDVHVKCLNDWRRASRNRTSYLACSQCGYRYHFARTRVAGLATNPIVLFMATIILFLVITFIAGSVMSYFLPPSLLAPSTAEPPPASKAAHLLQSLLEEADEDEDDFTSQLFIYTPAGAIQDVLESALRAFVSGDAFTLVGSWFGYKPTTKHIPIQVTGFKQTVRIVKEQPPALPVPGFLGGIVQKLLIGTATVGILSFINLLLSFSLLLPVQLGLRNIFRRGRRDTSPTSTALIILFVAIGLGRAIHKVYKLIRTLAGYILLRAETAILEVTQEDEVREQNTVRAYLQQQRLKFMIWRNWVLRLLKFDRAAWGDARRAVRARYQALLVQGDPAQ